MQYNWQQKDWPNFRYDLSMFTEQLYSFVEQQAYVAGLVEGLSNELQQGSIIDLMVAEALKTSAIEGEFLSREEVLSSIRNNLGFHRTPEIIKDKRVAGISWLMVAVREQFARPLQAEDLFHWHRNMMEAYLNINRGQWRQGDAPMQIVSGSIGREVVHFEAPPSPQVPQEMTQFLEWFNTTAPHQTNAILHAPVRAAIAHVYFESIHPFEDGNGRIGRAIAEKALSQGIGHPVLLSLSNSIAQNRQAYYDALKMAQRSNDITNWIGYFLAIVLKAQQEAVEQIQFTLHKTHFFDRFDAHLNARQEKVLQRMFAAGTGGFEGGMSTKKYMSIAKTSKATAYRDLAELAKINALEVVGTGRGTRYILVKKKTGNGFK